MSEIDKTSFLTGRFYLTEGRVIESPGPEAAVKVPVHPAANGCRFHETSGWRRRQYRYGDTWGTEYSMTGTGGRQTGDSRSLKRVGELKDLES